MSSGLTSGMLYHLLRYSETRSAGGMLSLHCVPVCEYTWLVAGTKVSKRPAEHVCNTILSVAFWSIIHSKSGPIRLGLAGAEGRTRFPSEVSTCSCVFSNSGKSAFLRLWYEAARGRACLSCISCSLGGAKIEPSGSAVDWGLWVRILLGSV